MIVDFSVAPELRLIDGTVIRNREDALLFLRAQEARPGIDTRDELLHEIERAHDPDGIERVAERFCDWLRELEVLDERYITAGSIPLSGSKT